jgi:hypothetical protein
MLYSIDGSWINMNMLKWWKDRSQQKNEAPGEKPVLETLCAPKIPDALPRDETWSSAQLWCISELCD